jgi:excisionase family DNA binding protein
MESSAREESFLTVAEVAEILKLNQQTVRNWIDQGSLPALRVGRRVRIKRSDFERVLEESYSPGTGVPATERGPSAEDFWGGTPVGLAEPDPLSQPSQSDLLRDGGQGDGSAITPSPPDG